MSTRTTRRAGAILVAGIALIGALSACGMSATPNDARPAETDLHAEYAAQQQAQEACDAWNARMYDTTESLRSWSTPREKSTLRAAEQRVADAEEGKPSGCEESWKAEAGRSEVCDYWQDVVSEADRRALDRINDGDIFAPTGEVKEINARLKKAHRKAVDLRPDGCTDEVLSTPSKVEAEPEPVAPPADSGSGATGGGTGSGGDDDDSPINAGCGWSWRGGFGCGVGVG